MNPSTVHLVCQEIRNRRAELTAEEKWAQSQQESDTKVEMFKRINFWRRLLDEAERRVVNRVNL